MADFVFDAFDLADTYRNPVMILADGALGQMMEKVQFREYTPADHIPPKPWATVGKPPTRARNYITSLHIQPEKMEQINLRLQEKYRRITEKEVRFETVQAEDAEYLLVAYGLVARIAHRAVELARAEGIRAGLLRPITLYPFPSTPLNKLAQQVEGMLVVEMNAGQMVEDVRLAVGGKIPVSFHGRMGGIVPGPEEVLQELKRLMKKDVAQHAEAYAHG
jgi:2-oxoglutarate ferredoxin oxidoreductase subunit alpha